MFDAHIIYEANICEYIFCGVPEKSAIVIFLFMYDVDRITELSAF